MTAITFDTYQFVQRLKESGIQEKQAEAITNIVKDANASAELATKGDLERLKAELREEMQDSKADIIKWVAGMLVAQSAVIAALVKLL